MTIARLFGRSPFYNLQGHMKQVAACMEDLRPLMQAFWNHEPQQVAVLAAKIGEQEHRADILKNNIRNQMSKGMLLPVDIGQLHATLTLQDDLADKAEDIAVLVSLRPVVPLEALHQGMDRFMNKNLECFAAACQVVREVTDVLETGFGGPEALRLKDMARRCAFLEHEGDVQQREMLRALYAQEAHLTFITFDFWSRLISEIGSIADLSESLSDHIRLMTEGS